MKLLHLEYDQYPLEAIRLLSEKFVVESYTCTTQQELYEKLNTDQYDVIITRLGLLLDQRCMNLQPGLRYIVTATTGLNHIDIVAAEARQISIISLKGEAEFLANVKSTAEHTWGLLLSLIRQLPAAIVSVRDGKWERTPFLSDELDEKKMGIIGFGRLGKIVARYAHAFGMTVLVHDQNPTSFLGYPNVIPCSCNELLSKADVVVLMISWCIENENFMDTVAFNQMKPGAYFINTARGELVDEVALLHALESGRLKGAALDVLRGDSSWSAHVEGSSALIKYQRAHSNLLITPHMGGYAKDSIAKTRIFVTHKFLSLINF